MLSQSNKTYPYTTVDDDGTKIVVMTTKQADLINKKYKDMEVELNALKTTIKTQHDTITQQKVIIKTQVDTITRYNEKVVYVKTDKDSISTQYTSLQDSLWKWALGPTLIYTTYPDTNAVYLMDLSHYYMSTDDFGIIMVNMSDKEYKKYQSFRQVYGLPEVAFWDFRSNMKIKKLSYPKLSERKSWKYKKQWNK